VNIVPAILSLSVAIAITLTGNSLPLLQPSHSLPSHSLPGQTLPGQTMWAQTGWARSLRVRPDCAAPWTFAIMVDGFWQCAGGPGPVVLPTPPGVAVLGRLVVSDESDA
jgi:hypothetical protein